MTGGLLFIRFAEQLKQEIFAEKYPVGSILPSISKLKESSGLSRNTVLAALKMLSEEGIISRVGAARYGFRVNDSNIANSKEKQKLEINSIALVFPFNYYNYIGSQLLQAMESAMSQSNYNLIIRNHENSPKLEAEILTSLLEQDSSSIKGIVLMTADSYSNPNIDLIKKFSRRIPLVLLDRYISGFDASFIGVNNRKIGREAADYLIDQGHHKLGFISGFDIISPMIDRLEGFKEAVSRRGLTLQKKHIFTNSDQFKILYQTDEIVNKLKTQIDFSDEGPSAYFCGDDKAAMTISRILEEGGKKVPEEVSIIGCDEDSFVQTASDNSISSFRYQFSVIARETIRLLCEVIEFPDRPTVNIEVSAEFIEKSTVGPVST